MTYKISRFRRWWIRLTHFEFWPFNVFYFPVHFYYAFLALRSRSFFFFTASNPSIEFGGMLGEKKSEIFDLLPLEYIPATGLFSANAQLTEILSFMKERGLQFPIIAKPNIGERGWMVAKLKTEEELSSYLENIHVDFLIQEFIDLPIELGVFYIKIPGQTTGQVTSIVRKGFMSVTGDGSSNVKQLLEKDVRAMLQVDFTNPAILEVLDHVPKKNEQQVIESIGNHCRGTTFLDFNHWIDDTLNQAFDHIASQIESFYFGRFDLRCRSIEKLRQAQDFKILELNGAGSEPGHVYQPGRSIFLAYRDVLWHLKMLRKVSEANRKRGHQFWSFSRGWKKMREIREYDRLKESAS